MARESKRKLPNWASRGRAFLGKPRRQEVITLNTLSIVVGVAAGYFAIAFRGLIGFFQNIFLHDQVSFQLMAPLNHVRGPLIILFPVFGLIAVNFLVRRFAPEASGHGVPEVMEAVITRAGRMRARIVAIKALASSLTIASGGSVGREGPIVQIGSATGSVLAQFFDLRPNLMRTLVGCGAAGAVAATFNTPIAGVIFAIEVIILELKTKSFIPLVISSVFATVISRFHLGNSPAFVVPEYAFVNPNELIFYLGLAVLAGITGVIIIRTLYGMEDLFDAMTIPWWLKAGGGGLVLGVLGFFVPEVLGVGYESVEAVLQQESSLQLMVALVFLKIFAMSLTLAAGGSGGVFAPSLFIGAMLGGAYGWVINHFFPYETAGYGAYALVGMAAVFTASSRAAFTAIVILIELTLDYSLILPLMFVCVLADQTAWFLSKHSIYSLKLKRKGLNLKTDIGLNIMAMTRIREVMTTKLTVLTETMNLEEARQVMRVNPHTLYPVVNESGELTGQVRRSSIRNELKQKGPESLIREVQKPVRSTAFANELVINVLGSLHRNRSRDPRIWVLDDRNKRLTGIVSPTDLSRLISRNNE